ncbi:MAG: hypothetical protein HYR66_18220, partial [Sphingobacteriales bacterium]|nr:hypothetical protein [Sphingobacteriales bacterium]
MRSLSFILLTCLLVFTAKSQSIDSADDSVLKLPEKYFTSIEKQSSQLGKKIDAKTEKTLKQFSKQEQKLYKKLYKIDSLAAKELFSKSQEKITELSNKLKNPLPVSANNVTKYIPRLDSVKTSLNFLAQYKDKIRGADKLKAALGKANILDSKLQSAEAIRNYLKQRKEQLKEALGKFGFAKELKKLNKQVYYYQAQLNEYKETLKDPKKIEKKALALLTKVPAFKQFMKKNSMLAGLFRMPDDDPAGTAAIAGLQTRTDMQQLLSSRFGMNAPTLAQGGNGGSYVQQQVATAQAEINKIKNKFAQQGGGSSDEELPDFKPNNQKAKSFLQRLEFGSNFQTSKNNQYFPTTTDIGLSVGYKLNDRSVIGIGTSYKLGLGTGFNNIRFTGEGVGLRSYIDWKLKGSFFVSGGYEFNYRNSFRSIA